MTATTPYRYALYACPEPGGAAWEAGSAWLGRCAADGRTLHAPRIAGVDPARFALLTATPRRYGFHATLKAPFRPVAGASHAAIVAAFEDFARREAPVVCPPLVATASMGFLALMARGGDARLETLAARCVAAFDRFRAPLAGEELARRRSVGLTPRQDELLLRWGYPFVMDAFRFHYSLTRPLPARGAESRVLRQAAQAHFTGSAAALGRVDGIALFAEPTRGADLVLLHYAALRARAGRLVYVVGPSGAGKDSVIAWARDRVPKEARVHFTRRTVTRAADPGSEDHDTLDREGFELARAAGRFAFWWEAHGRLYGIGREALDRLGEGDTVVVNGSREHLASGLVGPGRVEVVEVTADPERLRERLSARARENGDAVRERLARTVPTAPAGLPLTVIRNDGPLEEAGGAFLERLLSGGT